MAGVSWGQLTAITRRDIIPELQDTIYKSRPLFLYLYQKDRIVRDGGYQIQEPLLTGQPQASSYSRWQTLPVSPVELVQNLALEWKWYQCPVVIDGPAEAINAGVNKVLDIVAIAMQSAELQLRDLLGSDLWVASASPSATALDSVPSYVDDGSGTFPAPTTYAGISRTGNTFWQAQVLNAQSGGVNPPPSRSLFQKAYGLSTFGASAPDLIVCGQRVYDQMWEIAAAQQRYGRGDDFTFGTPFIEFNKARIMVDQSLNGSGYAFFLNTDFMKLSVLNTRNFYFTGWMMGPSQDARVGRIYWAGNLVGQNPRMNAKVGNISET
jgi:hypothetical protein